MVSYLWKKYADYVYNRWEKTFLWDMIEPYRRPKSFKLLVTLYVAAFYTGVVGAAITEQLYKGLFWKIFGLKWHYRLTFGLQRHVLKEKYWEDHPGEEVSLMMPKFYNGPWRVIRGEALRPPNQTKP